MIRITSTQDGFRRAGISHPAGPVDYADDAVTPAQLKQLQAEPKLVVELVADKKQAGK
jgi:hypothetical protein